MGKERSARRGRRHYVVDDRLIPSTNAACKYSELVPHARCSSLLRSAKKKAVDVVAALCLTADAPHSCCGFKRNYDYYYYYHRACRPRSFFNNNVANNNCKALVDPLYSYYKRVLEETNVRQGSSARLRTNYDRTTSDTSSLHLLILSVHKQRGRHPVLVPSASR